MESIKILFYINILSFININLSAIVKEIDGDMLASKYKDDYYIKAYKIPKSLMTFTTNGEKIYNNELDKAFDDDYETFWRASSRKATLLE